MTQHLKNLFIAVPGALALLAAALCAPADAAGAAVSAWHDGLNSRVRMVAGSVPGAAGARYAGIEIKLEDGWKTYWRNPGDAGIPPMFDWAGSENLATATVLYPLPHRLADPGGTAIGYKKAVLFPVRIEARDESRPVRLHLKLTYAVCAKLCIPADAVLSLTVAAAEAGAAPSDAIAAGLARVPRQTGGAAPPRAAGAMLEGEGKGKHLVVRIEHEADAVEPELFVEAPQGWYAGVPEEVSRGKSAAGLEITYQVPVRGEVSADEASGAALRLTIAAGGKAVEQSLTIP